MDITRATPARKVRLSPCLYLRAGLLPARCRAGDAGGGEGGTAILQRRSGGMRGFVPFGGLFSVFF